MCEQLPSGTDVTTNWCFWWELEKKTVFFILKAFSLFYAYLSLMVAMYMPDWEMMKTLKSAQLKSI